MRDTSETPCFFVSQALFSQFTFSAGKKNKKELTEVNRKESLAMKTPKI